MTFVTHPDNWEKIMCIHKYECVHRSAQSKRVKAKTSIMVILKFEYIIFFLNI